MLDTQRMGGCGCGQARYRLDGDPIVVNNCYCSLCQRQTGSTSVVNAFYETERVHLLQGRLSTHELTGGSGKPHLVKRCAQCGTALWSHYFRMGELGAGVRVGTLDDPASLRPDAAIFVADRMPWVTLPEEIPAFGRGYDLADILPPERLVRLNALVTRRAAQQVGDHG